MKVERYSKSFSGEIAYMLDHYEFKCKCENIDCNYTLFSSELDKSWSLTRAVFGKPLKINSGFRCQRHNRTVAGTPTSKHMLGEAIDISFTEFNVMDQTKLKEILNRFFDVVIEYGSFFHCHNNNN